MIIPFLYSPSTSAFEHDDPCGRHASHGTTLYINIIIDLLDFICYITCMGGAARKK